MENKPIDEFLSTKGGLLKTQTPYVDPRSTAKTTTDKSVRMRIQPFLYTIYRRFFSEGILPHNDIADKYQKDPEKFHKYLKEIGEGDKFEEYFAPDPDLKAQIKEVSRRKALDVIENLIDRRNSTPNREDILPADPLPTIDEIKEKEQLLLGKLDRIADYIYENLSAGERKVILSYFRKKIQRNGKF